MEEIYAFIIKTQINRRGKRSQRNTWCQAVMVWWKWSMRWRQTGSRDQDEKAAWFYITVIFCFLCWLTCGIIDQLFLILQISVPLCLLRPASIHPEFQLLTEIRLICEGFWSCARFTPFLEWHSTVACHKHWHLQWESSKASCCSEAEMFN